ncbi:MAG: 2-oxoacid:ferredoxin oxidoreductase subunit beta [Candidatus Firestonebacteria bacterium]
MVTKEDYISSDPSSWCPGCGNFSILQALKQALVELDLAPWQVVMVSGIGQAAKIPHYLRVNCFNGLHGRALPAAFGIKTVNHKLKVIAAGGDGDAYAEGGNHFIHAMRRNPDLTYLVHDNQIYGLTKGQASPTTDLGMKTGTTPSGSVDIPESPLAVAVAMNCSFVARGFAGDIPHLAGLIKQGINHKGFALIDILQPCVTFNKINTYQWYKDRVYKLDGEPGYDPSDRVKAFEKALEWGAKIPIGVIYSKERPVFEDSIFKPGDASLSRQPLNPPDFVKLLEQYL